MDKYIFGITSASSALKTGKSKETCKRRKVTDPTAIPSSSAVTKRKKQTYLDVHGNVKSGNAESKSCSGEHKIDAQTKRLFANVFNKSHGLHDICTALFGNVNQSREIIQFLNARVKIFSKHRISGDFFLKRTSAYNITQFMDHFKINNFTQTIVNIIFYLDKISNANCVTGNNKIKKSTGGEHQQSMMTGDDDINNVVMEIHPHMPYSNQKLNWVVRESLCLYTKILSRILVNFIRSNDGCNTMGYNSIVVLNFARCKWLWNIIRNDESFVTCMFNMYNVCIVI